MFHFLAHITVSSLNDDPFEKEVLFSTDKKEDIKLSIIESLSIEFFPEIQGVDIADNLDTILFGRDAKIQLNSFNPIDQHDFKILTGKLLSFS